MLCWLTVQMLYVHKNTLLYRLRRIEELLQYSFSDSYTRSYMRMSFLLLERHALLETVDERDVRVRREDRRDKSWKARVGADVRGGLAGETHIPEQRGAVEKVQARRRLLALDGGEIHHL